MRVPAVVAVEVIRVIRVVLEQQRLLVDDGVALLTDVLAETPSLLSVVARAAQVSGGPDAEQKKTPVQAPLLSLYPHQGQNSCSD